MQQINKKQKTIIVVIVIIVIISICYYVYAKEEFNIEENDLETFENNNNNNQLEKQESETEKLEKIIVHIAGAVNKEGVIELEENSRISDAIEKAGGFREDADTANINLAYKIEDGMKIYIPIKGEEKIQEKTEEEKSVSSTQDKSTKNEENKTQIININTAKQEELETLPGIGSATAQKIIAYRKENGKFKTKEEIKNVSGIGEAKYNNIKEQIRI